MAPVKKNKQKYIRRKKSAITKPMPLHQDPRIAKKTAEINAMLENAVFLPSRKENV